MIIKLGTNKATGESVVWDSENVVNRHFFLVGESGSGKTHTIRGLANGLASSQERIKCYIFDVHGDISTSNNLTSSINFGESGVHGLQPLAVDSDSDFGGVRKAISNFMSAFDATNPTKGELQHRVLYSSMIEMYEYFGFYANEPRSWNLHYDPRENAEFEKRQPTVRDLIEFMKRKHIKIRYGLDNAIQLSLKKLASLIKKVDSKITQEKLSEVNGGNELENEIEIVKQECVDGFTNFINSKWDENTIDFIDSGSEKILSSLISRLENLYSSGIFKEVEFDFDGNRPIQRFNISSLDVGTKRMFAQLMLSKIFAEEKAKGECSYFRCAIFLDEAKDYVERSEDGFMERIALEGRKFGISLIVAGQHTGQFKEETILQCATKIILGVDSMRYQYTMKKFSIPKEVMQNLQNRKTILVSIKEQNKKTSDFMMVNI